MSHLAAPLQAAPRLAALRRASNGLSDDYLVTTTVVPGFAHR